MLADCRLQRVASSSRVSVLGALVVECQAHLVESQELPRLGTMNGQAATAAAATEEIVVNGEGSTAALIFLHGWMQKVDGLRAMAEKFAKEVPHLKVIVPQSPAA